jgi:hypothetical protein
MLFREMYSAQQEVDFEAAVQPLLQWLQTNGHPHITVLVTQTHAELLEGQKTVPFKPVPRPDAKP